MAHQRGKKHQAYRWLRNFIEENKFSEVDKLPSENDISRKLGLCRETVRAALAVLERDGFVIRVRGSGTYINKAVAISSELDTGCAPFKVGLVLQGQDRDANSSLIAGIKEVLRPNVVDLRIFITDNKFSNERICLESVAYQNFNGFIIDGVKASLMNPNLDCYQKLVAKRMPVIFYNNYYKELPYPRVMVDDRECADRLVRILAEAGHRRIASIFVLDNYQSVEKFQGMATALKKYGLAFEDDDVMWCISDQASDPHFARSVNRFLRRIPHCTALLCCNYIILRLARRLLTDARRAVPDDLSLVCFDYSRDDWETEGITCSVHQGRRIGRETGQRIASLIESGGFEDNGHSCILEPQIHEGRSVRVIS